jgi:hypothetical protein
MRRLAAVLIPEVVVIVDGTHGTNVHAFGVIAVGINRGKQGTRRVDNDGGIRVGCISSAATCHEQQHHQD